MHMTNALLSPVVGGLMWSVSTGAVAYSSRKVREELDNNKVSLMGVTGAFLFAAQMINFGIPATGSSGHLGGGLLLAILLGPHAAFLTIAAVLTIQSLFFADGGLLALGCNIFNMGVIPAFMAYPLIYKPIAGSQPQQKQLPAATMLAALASLQLGPLAVVLETACSGISALPFSTFLSHMQPIHLAIGCAEGLITLAVVSAVHRTHPNILLAAQQARAIGRQSIRTVILAFMALAIFSGGLLSLYASNNPDGLEWAISKASGQQELKAPQQGLHGFLSMAQEKTAFLPEYTFRKAGEKQSTAEVNINGSAGLEKSAAGILGGLMTLSIVGLGGALLARGRKTSPAGV